MHMHAASPDRRHDRGGPDQLRIAVISTPRSGNTWLRFLLSATYGLEPVLAHTPEAVPWSTLPPRCVLQLHWLPSPAFLAALDTAGFEVVTIARHPIDVLVSVLQFASGTSATESWVAGTGGNERPIAGASPASPLFLRYACSERAETLLGIGAAWWRRPGVSCVRYEELVDDPHRGLTALADDIGPVPPSRIEAAVAGSSMAEMRRAHPGVAHHFWQGRAELWRALVPAEHARLIHERHTALFEHLGYGVGGPGVDRTQAELAWLRLRVPGLSGGRCAPEVAPDAEEEDEGGRRAPVTAMEDAR